MSEPIVSDNTLITEEYVIWWIAFILKIPARTQCQVQVQLAQLVYDEVRIPVLHNGWLALVMAGLASDLHMQYHIWVR